MSKLCILISVISLIASAHAADYPTTAFLHGADGLDSLTFECSAVSDTQITCRIAQARVAKSTKEDISTLLSNAENNLDSKEFRPPDNCDTIYQKLSILKQIPEDLTDVLENPSEYMTQQEQLEMPINPVELSDSITYYDAMAKYCNQPNLETYKHVLIVTHGIEVRTCRIHPLSITQEFKLMAGDLGWVSNSGPNGLCGTVVVSSLQKAKDNTGFWTYTMQKVVTNKNSEFCSGLDEKAYFYDWKGRTVALNCDYILFGF